MGGKTSKWQKMIGKHRMPLLRPNKVLMKPRANWEVEMSCEWRNTFLKEKIIIPEAFLKCVFLQTWKRHIWTKTTYLKRPYVMHFLQPKWLLPKRDSNGKFGAWISFPNTLCDSLKQTIETSFNQKHICCQSTKLWKIAMTRIMTNKSEFIQNRLFKEHVFPLILYWLWF